MPMFLPEKKIKYLISYVLEAKNKPKKLGTLNSKKSSNENYHNPHWFPVHETYKNICNRGT